MHMKTVCLAIVFLLAVNIVSAAGIELFLNNYDSKAMQAKIQIKNTGETGYGEVYLSVDGAEPTKVANGIGKGMSVVVIATVLPGSHLIKVTTKEGASAEKRFNFAKTLDQILQEKEEGKLTAVSASNAEQDANYQKLLEEQKKKIEEMKQTEEEAEKTPEQRQAAEVAAAEKPKFNTKILVITLVVILFAFGIVYYLLKGKGGNVQQTE